MAFTSHPPTHSSNHPSRTIMHCSFETNASVFLFFLVKITKKHKNQLNRWKQPRKVFWPAFGNSQHPKAIQNTQQVPINYIKFLTSQTKISEASRAAMEADIKSYFLTWYLVKNVRFIYRRFLVHSSVNLRLVIPNK